jgi:exonuclease SbcD
VRLLHTSDWHLGRTLHGAALLEHQAAFLRWLCDSAVERRVDAVVVAGDVYDRAVPPPDAVRLLDDALSRLASAGVAVLITSGNHDSAVRLGFGARLAESAGVHLRTRLDDLCSPLVVDGVGVYGIPYLLPDAVMAELGAARSHESVLQAAVDRVLADARSRRLERVVVASHAFVTGGVRCESERDVSVGGIGDAPASVFAGVDYAALGHLHGAQQIATNVRYCGSPLPFSFSERFQRKSVDLVEIGVDGVRVESLPVPVPRPMVELRGRIDELLADPAAAPRDAWVKVVLTDPARPSAPMERLREVWPHTLVLDFRPDVQQRDDVSDLARLREAQDPVEICALFVEWVDSTYPDRHSTDELREAVEVVRRLEASA